MKGNNELHINQATMLEAINLWIASTFKAPLTATQVCGDGKSGNGFIIKVMEPEKKDSAA